MKTKRPLQANEAAEIVAIQALSHLAGTPELLGRFLAETGLGPETLRKAASDPQFLSAVLDFVLRDDNTAAAFATASGLELTTIVTARLALGGERWERDVP